MKKFYNNFILTPEEVTAIEDRLNELERILRDFLTTKECRETWIEEMRGTIDAVLNEKNN